MTWSFCWPCCCACVVCVCLNNDARESPSHQIYFINFEMDCVCLVIELDWFLEEGNKEGKGSQIRRRKRTRGSISERHKITRWSERD